jgi:hypothetical protein
MNFTRKRVKGQNQKHHKLWLDDDKRYRITWRRECFGVRVPPAFFACVRCQRSMMDSTPVWYFAGQRRPYKTFEKAKEICELHERIWNAVAALNDEKHYVNKLRELRASHGRIGAGPLSQDVLTSLPKWVMKAVSRRILDTLFPASDLVREELCLENLSDPTETSPSSADSTDEEQPTSIPASTAGDEAGTTTTKTRRARSKAIDTETQSPAPSAKARGVGRKQPAGKRTKRQSPGSTKKRGRTTGSKT